MDNSIILEFGSHFHRPFATLIRGTEYTEDFFYSFSLSPAKHKRDVNKRKKE